MTSGLPPRFLVVDDNADTRQLLVRALTRKFPRALIHECRQGDAALAVAQRVDVTAIISHRTFDHDGESLVALFRRVNPAVPIVMVSGYDRSARAEAAGADAFLNYDQWLMIGTVVSEAIAAREQSGRKSDRAENAGEALSPQSA